MTTQARRDLDTELSAWLEQVRDQQAPAAAYTELFRANEAAKAIKDPNSPAAAAAHEQIDAALSALGY